MAETKGLVHRVTILTNQITCVWIGPTPNNVEALLVNNDGTALNTAFANQLIQALTAASSNYREVIAVHADMDAAITSLRIEPV
jgi:hypothetical protein